MGNLMRIKILTIFTIILYWLVPIEALSRIVPPENETPKWSIGLFAGYTLNSQIIDFTKLKPYPSCCPELGRSNGSGYNIGMEFFLYDDELNFEEIDRDYDNFLFGGFKFKAGYIKLVGNSIKSQTEVFGYTGEPVAGEFQYTFDSKLGLFYIEPQVAYYFGDGWLLTAGIGVGILTEYKFSQEERITKPGSGAVFTDTKTNVRNVVDNKDIPDVNKFQYYGSLGFGYIFRLAENCDYLLIPSVDITYGSKISSSVNRWNVFTLQYNLAFHFSSNLFMKTEKELREERYQQELLLKKKEAEEAEIRRKEEQARLEREKQELEAKLAKEKAEKEREAAEQKRLEDDRIQNENRRLIAEAQRIESERIDSLNRHRGIKCDCYMILYISTPNQNQAETLLTQMKNNGIENLKVVKFYEKYLKTNYYRVVSECFSNHSDAFYKRFELEKKLTGIELSEAPVIICE